MCVKYVRMYVFVQISRNTVFMHVHSCIYFSFTDPWLFCTVCTQLYDMMVSLCIHRNCEQNLPLYSAVNGDEVLNSVNISIQGQSVNLGRLVMDPISVSSVLYSVM